MSTPPAPTPATDVTRANALLAEVAAAPTIVNVARAAQKLPMLREALGKLSLRVACLSSFTFDPLKPYLELQALRANIAADAYVGPYGQCEQELVNPASGLGVFQPDVVIVAVHLQDVCPAIYQTFNALVGDAAARMVDDWLARLRSALLSFRERWAAHVLIQSYDLPACPALSLADRTAENSQSAIIGRANHGLDELAASMKNVRVMDYDALVAAHGRLHWQDARTAFFARIPVAPANYWALAGRLLGRRGPLERYGRPELFTNMESQL
jgi:predicted enzyme involved in methoxymalonyl-ACP biosynthesis